jgi:hypothetical protein
MSKEMREQIDNFKNFLLKESVDRTFKNKILSSRNAGMVSATLTTKN